METAYSILHNHLSPPYCLSLLIVFIVTLFIWKVVEKRQTVAKKTTTQSILIALFVTYIFFILLITLIAKTPAAESKAELIPFWSWYEVIINHSTSLAVEIILNVVLFMPVGILARLLDSFGLHGVKMRRVAIFSLFFSLSIEVTQYFTCRGLCEIFDDVIHNTVGGVIGYGICGYVMRLVGKRRSFNKYPLKK